MIVEARAGQEEVVRTGLVGRGVTPVAAAGAAQVHPGAGVPGGGGDTLHHTPADHPPG